MISALKTESFVKKFITEDVRRSGGYARRFEDKFGVGIPDTILILNGLPPIFAEVKIFTGQRFGPTDRQLVELTRINAQQPRIYGILIGWKNGIYYFSEAKSVALIGDCFSVTQVSMSFSNQLYQFWAARLRNVSELQ